MKFKKYLSLSAACVMIAGAVGLKAAQNTDKDYTKHRTEIVTPNFNPYPELKQTVDTIYITKDMFGQTFCAGEFKGHTVKMTYFAPGDSEKWTSDFCEANNSMYREVWRHEMEHARKALLTRNQDFRHPVVGARIAAMNEIQAPAAEALQAADDQFYHGMQCPNVARLKTATKKILAANETSLTAGYAIDYTNPAVADAVLDHGVSKFISDFNHGVYRWTMRQKLDGKKTPYYIPHQEVDTHLLIGYSPEQDMWGPMFTYTTRYGKKVDIWKNATPKMRAKVLERVDSAINVVAGPAEMQVFKQAKKSNN